MWRVQPQQDLLHDKPGLMRANTFVADLKDLDPGVYMPVIGEDAGKIITPLDSSVFPQGWLFPQPAVHVLREDPGNLLRSCGAKAKTGSVTLSMAYIGACLVFFLVDTISQKEKFCLVFLHSVQRKGAHPLYVPSCHC